MQRALQRWKLERRGIGVVPLATQGVNDNNAAKALWEQFGIYIRQNNFLTGGGITLNPVCTNLSTFFERYFFLVLILMFYVVRYHTKTIFNWTQLDNNDGSFTPGAGPCQPGLIGCI